MTKTYQDGIILRKEREDYISGEEGVVESWGRGNPLKMIDSTSLCTLSTYITCGEDLRMRDMGGCRGLCFVYKGTVHTKFQAKDRDTGLDLEPNSRKICRNPISPSPLICSTLFAASRELLLPILCALRLQTDHFFCFV